MHTCANRSGGPNTKKIVLAYCAWSPLPIGGGGHRCANILAHRSRLQAHTSSIRKGYTFRFFNIMYSFTSPIGGPNISVRLAYFHPNRLLIELYKQETEIRCKKDDGPIKKLTDIDHHGPVPYSISGQTPDPPHFSLPTTFKPFHLV